MQPIFFLWSESCLLVQRSVRRGRYTEQEIAGASLAVGEGVAELTLDEEAMGQLAEFAEGYLVLDVVGEESAFGVGANFGAHGVAVVPVGERTVDLAVAEAMVPEEVGDLCLPLHTDGREREGTEADSQTSSDSGGDAAASFRCGVGWGWSEDGCFDAGVLPGRHEAR
jgi:hypothetical protein